MADDTQKDQAQSLWDDAKPWYQNIAGLMHKVSSATDPDTMYANTYDLYRNSGFSPEDATRHADTHMSRTQSAMNRTQGIAEGTGAMLSAPVNAALTGKSLYDAYQSGSPTQMGITAGLASLPFFGPATKAVKKMAGYDHGGAVKINELQQQINNLKVNAKKHISAFQNAYSEHMANRPSGMNKNDWTEKFTQNMNEKFPEYVQHQNDVLKLQQKIDAINKKEQSEKRKTAMLALNEAMQNHDDLINNAHKIETINFKHLPIQSFNEANTLNAQNPALSLHKSPSYNGRQSSEYKLMMIDGKPAYARKSNHWGKFYTNIKDIEEAKKHLGLSDEEAFSRQMDDPFGRIGRLAHNWNLEGHDGNKNISRAGYVHLEDLDLNKIRRSYGGIAGYEKGGTVDAALKIARDRTKSSAKWGQNKSLEFEDLAKILENVRSTKLGRAIERYQTPEAGEATQLMYKDLLGLAKEGTPGRKWYEKSSKRILDYLGGDKNEADKFAQLIAIYSPQTQVPTNTSNAIKAYNRSKTGHPIWNGQIIDRDKTFDKVADISKYIDSLGGSKSGITKVPLDDTNKRFLIARHDPKSYENIATADRDLKAHLVMNEGIPFEGRKTNNFYNNLMVHIDPHRLQGSTQDLWMAKAFGFHDPAIGSGAKYDYMERLTEKLAKELNWKPHQVQAAIWTAMKTREESIANDAKREAVKRGLAKFVPGTKGKDQFVIHEGNEDQFSELLRDMAMKAPISRKNIKESSKDFSDFLDQNLAHIAWESVPSKRIAHLQGLEDLPPEARAEYHGLMSRAMHDDKGNDLLAKYLGIMTPGSQDAPGYWEEKSNPASHVKVASTRIKGAKQRPDIDEPSKELLNIYSDAKGLLHKQDGVGYHRPFYNPKLSEANGVQYEFDKDLTPEHIINIGKALDTHAPGTGLIPVSPRKVRVINFSNNYPDQRHFHKASDNALGQSGIGDTHTAEATRFASDGDLRGNDWETSKNGEDYRQRLSASKRPDVLKFISTVLAPRVEAVDREFAQKHGLQTDPQLESTLRSLHTQGPAGTQGLNQFNQGGRVHPALNIPGLHIRTAEAGEPIFSGRK